MNIFLKNKPDLFILLTFLLCVAGLIYCYPTAQLTWDSFYYLEIAEEIKPSLRPYGYPYFLHFLADIRRSFPFITLVQYCLYFFSIWSFLKVSDSFLRLAPVPYTILGILLVVEPVGLYHCFNVLSDVLFSALTLGYISTLLLYIRKRNVLIFILHLLLIYASIEVRHIALFYPFFSFVLLIWFHRSVKAWIVYAIVIFGVFYSLNRFHIRENEKRYNTAVYSPFSGWTHANNALYSLHLIKLSPNEIKDPEIRQLHSFFTSYMDTSGYKPAGIGSAFLWDDKSPLCVLRQKMQDSLGLTFVGAWYKLAPSFGKYGMYLQKHYPLQYFKGYMVPNFQTLIKPHDGEMMDYFATPEWNPYILEWYYKKQSDFHVRKQLYKEHINHWNTYYYQLRLALFTTASVLALVLYKRLGREKTILVSTLILFTGAFYLLTWYSSWFMQRYMIPIFPMQVTVIFIIALSVISRKKMQV